MQPLVSIIVPIYRTEKYLKRCVDSILSQTLTDIEVILVDDDSPDNCPKICDEYAHSDSRIKVIHKRNDGVSAARNAGIDAASGKYIGFVDSDDYVEPDMFECLAEHSEKTGCGVSVASFYETYQGGETHERTVPNKLARIAEMSDFDELIQCEVGCYVWNKLFRTAIIRGNSVCFQEGVQLIEDALFYLDYIKFADSVCFIGKPVYHYMRNGNSICATYQHNAFELHKTLYRKRIETAKFLNKTELTDDGIQCAFLKNITDDVLKICSKGNNCSGSEKIAELKRIAYDEDARYVLGCTVKHDDKQHEKAVGLLKTKNVRALRRLSWFYCNIVLRARYYFK